MTTEIWKPRFPWISMLVVLAAMDIAFWVVQQARIPPDEPFKIALTLILGLASGWVGLMT